MTNPSTLLHNPTGTLGPAVRLPLRGIAWIGRTTRTGFENVGRNTRFLLATGHAIGDVRTWGPLVSLHLRRLGIDSLPLAIFIALFTGIVLAMLASYSLTGAVPLYFVGTLVEKTITMELAPVLTGLALAGRVGASIAAEIGTMKVTEQVDALETLAYHPLAYLVVPRVLAGTLMFPIVVAAAMITGMLSGWIASVGLLEISSTEFIRGMRLFFDPFDVRYGLVKSASFGLAVTLIGSVRGLRTHGGAEGVGRGATSAVVYSAVTILLLDAFWALLWLRGTEIRGGG